MFRYKGRSERVSRGFRGGFEGVQLGLPLLTLSQPSANPQATPRQPPMKYEQMMVKKMGEKRQIGK